MSTWKSIQTIGLNTGERRQLKKGAIAQAIALFAAGIALYHLYTLWGGHFNFLLHRYIHLTLLLALAFLVYAGPSKQPQIRRLPIKDVGFALVPLAVLVYLYLNLERFQTRDLFLSPVTPLDMFFGILLILALVAATRRALGTPLLIVAMATLLYVYAGPYLTGIWYHPGYSVAEIFEGLWMEMRSIWDIPLGVSATYIIVFLIFAGLLVHLGGGEFFVDLSKTLVGKMRGGPAKVAVLASGFLGSITSSPSANVAATGSVTIPLMKKLGYKPHFAGAVEAAASTGGIIMPPVMGSVAFLMSEVTGIPYMRIITSAILPALLYYLAVLMMVHFEAVKTGLGSVAKEELELLTVKRVLKGGGEFLIPFGVLITILVMGYSPVRAGLWATATLLLLCLFRKERRRGLPRKTIAGLEAGARSAIVVVTACAFAGIIMNAIFDTGLALKISSILAVYSRGSILLGLLIVAIPTLILGMGLSAIPSYLIVSITLVPAIVDMGVPLLAAHMFALFFSTISFITPPVAIAAFVAGGIANADPLRVAATASRLGIVGFFVPFMFAFEPSLLLIGEPVELVLTVITSVIGVVALASGFEGWLLIRTKWWQQILLLLAGLALIYPSILTDGIGIAVIIMILAIQWKQRSLPPPTVT